MAEVLDPFECSPCEFCSQLAFLAIHTDFRQKVEFWKTIFTINTLLHMHVSTLEVVYELSIIIL